MNQATEKVTAERFEFCENSNIDYKSLTMKGKGDLWKRNRTVGEIL